MPSFDWKKVVVLLLQAIIAALSGSIAGNLSGHSAAVNCCAKVAPK